jgi:hypothetical protein
MDEGKKQKLVRVWLKKIDSEEAALEVIRETSYGFFIVSGLLIVVSLLMKTLGIVDGVLYASFGALLLKFKSRVAAVMLLMLSFISVIVTVLNRFSAERSGGTNMLLAVMVCWAGVRAVQAAFALEKLRKTQRGS